MSEALKLFKDISNYKLFNNPQRDTAIILFLNKRVIFYRKFHEIS